MFTVLVLFLVTFEGGYGAFFDATDVDDPLALLWNTKDFIISPKNKECTVHSRENSTLSGVCLHKSHCYLSGGQIHSHGSCGILQTCCTYHRSCSKRTKAKISYFTSGDNPPQECDYVVETENENICQIRLDFETFVLSPSSRDDVNQEGNRPFGCLTDALTVSPATYNVPSFCGFNDGQHVYIHLEHEREIKLKVHLGSRTQIQNDNDLDNIRQIIQSPKWRIKVTQLECPGKSNFFSKHNYNLNLAEDFNLLAPRGAIQYFTKLSGRFRSFGFDGRTSGNYLNGLNYGVAFKKRPDTCLRFTTSYFLIRTTASLCEDYLFVPEANTQNLDIVNDDRSKICGNVLQATSFTSNTPGPFYVNFMTKPTIDDGPVGPDGDVVAFDLQYETYKC